MEEPPNKDDMDCEKQEELRKSTVGKNEVDCDELEETMKSMGADRVRTMAYDKSSAVVQKEKQGVAYPISLQKQKSIQEASPGVLGPGLGHKSKAKVDKDSPGRSAHTSLRTETGKDSTSPSRSDSGAYKGQRLIKMSRDTHPSYISYLDESLPSDNIESPIQKNYLDKESPPSPSHNKPLPEDDKNRGSLRLLPRPYLSYLNSASPPNSDRQLPLHDIEPMPMPPQSTNDAIQQQHPGAYSEAPGANVQRLDQLRFSLVGVRPVYVSGDVNNAHSGEEDIDARNRNNYEADMDVQSDNNGRTEAGVPTNAILPRPSNVDLAVATAIDNFSSVLMMEAKEIDPEVVRKQTEERKRKKLKMIGYIIIVICSIILGLSLGLSLGMEDTEPSTSQPTMAPSQSPTRPLPLMGNLELLYDELPEKTRESLYSRESPQYHAWEWLLNHPDITTYSEWRKKQVFAMATFFYSFEGPHWPEPIRNKWLNLTASECDWTLSEAEVLYFTQEVPLIFGPDAYSSHDIHPCNQNGEIQTLIVHQLYSSDKVEPYIPPEIGFLTSLKVLAIQSSQIGGSELTDFLAPELILLPNLEFLSFHSTGIGGTIPKEVYGMTGLRHLIIGDNQLTGTFPTEIANMSSLEFLDIWENSISGSIPSELGWMTSLTALEIHYNFLTGTIPSELGLLTTIQQLWLQNNALGESIPTELGLMTRCAELSLGNNVERSPGTSHNNFVGSLPAELWQLSSLEELILYNLPNLHGSIPPDMMLNLTVLGLEGSPNLGGTIPDVICSLQEQKFDINFDCSHVLCGCDCQCVNNKTNDL